MISARNRSSPSCTSSAVAMWGIVLGKVREMKDLHLEVEVRRARARAMSFASPHGLAIESQHKKQEQDGDIVVHGSAQLVQTLFEHDLVDEFRLMVYPVVLGSGKRLFGETSDKKPLRLVDSKVVGDGVAILVYQPVGSD